MDKRFSVGIVLPLFLVGIFGLPTEVLATEFDVSTAVYSQAFDISGQGTSPEGLTFNTDGTKMFVAGDTGDDISEYSLSTGFDVSTASYVDSLDISGEVPTPTGVSFNTDGTKMYVVGSSASAIVQSYSLSTGFDVSTASALNSLAISGQENNPEGIAFNTDGTKLFIVGTEAVDVSEYTLSTGFDITSASFVDSTSIIDQGAGPTDIAFNTDGTKMFISDPDGIGRISEYTLSTGFDASTLSFVDAFTIFAQEPSVSGLSFNNNGTKMYIVGNSNYGVYEYTLPGAVPDLHEWAMIFLVIGGVYYLYKEGLLDGIINQY